ncbi:MAG: hypothetical protein ACSLEM_02575 [Candidatus Malihini olakiniferum]
MAMAVALGIGVLMFGPSLDKQLLLITLLIARLALIFYCVAGN